MVIILPLFGLAQNANSASHYDSKALGIIVLEKPAYGYGNDDAPDNIYKYDTVKVILLIADLNTGNCSTAAHINPLLQSQNDNRIPFWDYGFVVNKKTNRSYFTNFYITFEKYLTVNKQDMPESFVVLSAKTY